MLADHWESPFIPSQLTFKKFQISLNFTQAINQTIKTFQYLEFWDVTVMLLDHDEPTNYEEAMMSPDAAKWLEAMKSEMGSMYGNKV